jgi:hypothetical protein
MIPTQQLLFLHQHFGQVTAYSREIKQEKNNLSNLFIKKASLFRATL